MKHLWIGDNPKLEAIAEGEERLPCAIITHPHPLYGGNMYNNVVEAAKNAALANGYKALRFNFRGTGQSEGIHEDGRGEVEDLDTVVKYAGNVSLIIGYSFGAWIAAKYIKDNQMPCILISPPNMMFGFSSLKGLDVWAIAGENDQFCKQEVLTDILEKDRITICRGADHFWSGWETFLQDILSDIFTQMKG
jgi:alpha/beta superfamily hydrolase